MTIRLVTYSDQNMTISRKKCIQSFLSSTTDFFEVDYHEWDREMIEQTSLYVLNREILDQERGSGYWLWKPYIIYVAMLDMKDGDTLIYSDSGVEFINSVQHIIDVMDEDLFLFGNNWNHVDWCKADVIKAVGLTVSELYENSTFTSIPVGDDVVQSLRYDNPVKQVQASVIFIRVSKESKEFVKSWLMYCQMPNLIDDSPSKLPNYPTFSDHRHDQAILTCLQIKHGYKLHWWPASYSNGAFVYDKLPQYKEDKYPVIFNHHRKRNNEW